MKKLFQDFIKGEKSLDDALQEAGSEDTVNHGAVIIGPALFITFLLLIFISAVV